MSSTHLTKKDLKNDPLTHEVEVGVHYVSSHRSMLTKAGIGIAVLLVAAGGYSYYSNSQAAAREKAFLEARRVMIAQVGAAAKPPALSFTTQEEKDKAMEAAYSKVAAQYPGSPEGAIAKLYIAANKADKGEMDAAAADYREVISSAPKPFVSTAKISLGQILYGQGKTDEGRKLIQDVIDSPTEFVSTEEATLALARLLVRDKPDEARKLLEPLTKSRSAVSTVAVELSAQLAQTAN